MNQYQYLISGLVIYIGVTFDLIRRAWGRPLDEEPLFWLPFRDLLIYSVMGSLAVALVCMSAIYPSLPRVPPGLLR